MSDHTTETRRRLLLLRHAKSGWDDPALSDHDRPLSARGRAAAPRIGAHMERAGYAPSLVLCSSSRRTQETFERLRPALPAAPALEVVPELYLASPGTLLSCIEAVVDTEAAVLVIAHNPGIAELASALSRRGPPALRRRLRHKYPTGALAVFDSSAPTWQGADYELVDFACPRDLPDA